MQFQSINPYNGKIIKTYEALDEQQVELKIAKSHAAYLNWKTTSFDKRKALIKSAASELRNQKVLVVLS